MIFLVYCTGSVKKDFCYSVIAEREEKGKNGEINKVFNIKSQRIKTK